MKKIFFILFSTLSVSNLLGQLHSPVSCTTAGTKGEINWSTTPNGVDNFDWAPNGALSNSFFNISGTGVNVDVSFSGETGTFGTWGGEQTPCVNTSPTSGVEECLSLLTNGFGSTGISITMDFDIALGEIAFDLSNVNSVPGANGDLYRISALNSHGQVVYPTFTSSANPSYVTNTTGVVDANASSVAGDDDNVGINLSDPNGLVSFTVTWENCTTCQEFFVHGLGIMDIEFCISDVDGDGIQNLVDIDDDNDGITDIVESQGNDPTADLDGDGVYAYLDDNDNNATIFNNDGKVEAIFDFDGDNIPNHLDLDSDNDGTSDIAEAGVLDPNGDGQVFYPIANDPTSMVDKDSDGHIDIYDNSLVANLLVRGDCSGAVANYNHNITYHTSADAFSNVTVNFCLTGDYGQPISNNESITVVGEGGVNLGTFTKLTSDNPTYADCETTSFCNTLTITQAQWNLWNNDGQVNLVFTPSAGVNFCTNYSCLETAIATFSAGVAGTPIDLVNFDNTSKPDYLDLDSDNDGLSDLAESVYGSTTADYGGGTILDGKIGNLTISDANINGWDDAFEGVDARPDSDGDGLIDGHDADSDNDGIIDKIEGTCTTCPQVGITSVTDTDGDGFSDHFENLTNLNANGGSNQGLVPNDDDDDSDGIPDYLDIDSDGDGAYDWSEGYDTDGDGNATPELPNYAINFAALGGNPTYYPSDDPEYDGIPVFMDNRPSVYGINEDIRPPFYDATTSYWHDDDNDGLVDLLDPDVNGNAYGTAAPIPNNDGVLDVDFRDLNYVSPLPVELVSFQAIKSSSDVLLKWITKSEKNSSHFIIQKSRDGVVWQFVEEVEGAGNSVAELNYLVTDKNPYSGLSYYRLKQVDFDGEFEFSEIRSVDFDNSLGFSVYPNPVRNILYTKGVNLASNDFKIINSIGKTVYYKSADASASNNIEVNMSNFTAGVYTIIHGSEICRVVVR